MALTSYSSTVGRTIGTTDHATECSDSATRKLFLNWDRVVHNSFISPVKTRRFAAAGENCRWCGM